MPAERGAFGAKFRSWLDARLDALESAREYTERQERDKMLIALRVALGDDELQKFMAEGAAWSEDTAVAEAMLV